jgi:hypothetical protein
MVQYTLNEIYRWLAWPEKTEKGGKDENASNARLDKFSLANGYCP